MKEVCLKNCVNCGRIVVSNHAAHAPPRHGGCGCGCPFARTRRDVWILVKVEAGTGGRSRSSKAKPPGKSFEDHSKNVPSSSSHPLPSSRLNFVTPSQTPAFSPFPTPSPLSPLPSNRPHLPKPQALPSCPSWQAPSAEWQIEFGPFAWRGEME